MRWPVLLVAALIGCNCGGPKGEVRWPASAAVALDDELAVSAVGDGQGKVLLPNGQAVDVPELPQDAAGIRARSFVFSGLWVAEVVLGHVEDDDVPLPLVLMLHGRGDRPRIPGGPLGRVPTPMRVLVPRGPLSLGDGFAWARFSVTQGRSAELSKDLIAASDRLVSLLNHVRSQRPTAGDPIVTGFSQGAMVAWTMAMRHPQQVGLAIVLAGWVPPEARPSPLREAPTQAMHGTADDIVRIEPTRQLIEELGESTVDVRWSEFADVGHTVTPEMNALFESWLEEALSQRAPDLGGGLGEPGQDVSPVTPYDEPVDIDLEEEAVPAEVALPNAGTAKDGGVDAGARDGGPVDAQVDAAPVAP